MGLFDKKFCDICGQKIGLLGNRKLDDGNLCKDCASKLSPFFSERRSSTVDMIRQQLDYREENRAQLDSLHPDVIFGQGKKIYIDRNARKFVVTRSSDFRANNPDIIDFSHVMNVGLDIREHKDEVFTTDKEGKRVPYNPRRFKIEYEFDVKLAIDSPWFNEINIELSENRRPANRVAASFHELEDQGRELKKILTSAASAPVPAPAAHAAVVEEGPWVCPNCNATNTGKFCEYCGTPRM